MHFKRLGGSKTTQLCCNFVGGNRESCDLFAGGGKMRLFETGNTVAKERSD